MKFTSKKILPVICALGMFFACSMTVFAGSNPTFTVSESNVSVSHEDTSTKIKIKVKDWKSSTAFKVKYEVGDSDIAKAELDSQSSDSAKIKIKCKGTGNTYLKVWLDGFSRDAQYVTIKSINYQKDDKDGYSIRHYGYMTGTNGEAATIDDYEVENVDGEERLYVYFTLIDKGTSDGAKVTFMAKCEEDDGDALGTMKATATGMTEGGSGYKVYFKLPDKTSVVKLVNDDL